MKKKFQESKYYPIIVSVVTGFAILAATIAVILYATGYRLQKTGLSETGQLVLKSDPDAASVFINNKFVAGTNSTLNLPPGEYNVKIVKDGYSTWEKKLKIEKEVVTPTDAILFPTAPELRRFTSTGAINPMLSLDRTKIAYGVTASTSYPPKNGVYVASIADRQNVFFSGGTQFIVRDTQDIQFSKGEFLFSPDGKQLLVYFKGENLSGVESTKTQYGGVDLNNLISAYLLDTTRQTQEDVPDVSLNLAATLDSWQKEKEAEQNIQFNTLKSDLRKVATSSMEILDFTIDESKFMYKARQNADIPVFIKPRLIGTNSTPEVRHIEKGKLYIYDIKEDRNYEISAPGENVPVWLDTSRHYMTIEKNKIYVTEYDGQNKTLVYSGPFEKNFVTTTPNGNRIFFLTTFSPDVPLNLYALLVR